MSTRFKFTHRLIDQLPRQHASSPSRFAEYSDIETTGLKVLVSKSGRKWFYARLTFHGSKRAIKLGEYPTMGVADARQKIMELRTQGISAVQQKVLTFTDFTQHDYLPYAKAHKRSVASDISKLRVHLLPLFGCRYIHEITFRDIQTYHANLKVSHCAATANRHLSLLSKIFSVPCNGVYLKKIHVKVFKNLLKIMLVNDSLLQKKSVVCLQQWIVSVTVLMLL